jgi:geranylgeranyl pyrophosphate synthase
MLYNCGVKAATSDFQEYLQSSSGEIKKELTSYLSLWEEKTIKSSPDLQQPLNQFISRTFGGKMLRGTLVKLGYELITNTSAHSILKPACAYEIIHTALLTHDDIIDQSSMRRGQPALHLLQKDKHYGISLALCLGDLGLLLATNMVSESDFPEKEKMKALNNFLQIITDTVLGEMLDVKASHSITRTEKQILQIHEKKTAQYTITGPLSLGAILAGASDTQLRYINEFGKPLGIAYQLHDDLLGIFADKKVVGKSVTSDIEENKSTLLIVYAQQHATEKQQEIIKKYYGKKNITADQHEQIKKVFENSGALSYSREKIASLSRQAKAIVPEITNDKKSQLLLLQLADLATTREK